MAPTFPGMNPYLENPSLWSEVHSWLMVELARSLNPLLIPKYRVQPEDREPVINLSEILRRVYQETSLAFAIDYSVQSFPPLSESDFSGRDR